MSKEPKFKTYTISDLSKEFEVTPRALRLYEESGLLGPKREGNKRIYLERDRVRLRLLLRGKRLGCTLSEIKDIFDMYETKSGEKGQILMLLEKMDDRRKKLQIQRQDVDMALEEIERVYQKIRKSLDEIEASEKINS
ncbi:MerR family transcriptional regulator [uncultured Cocleimonas sp.]|uniref:MerR family transcriptional regulator n=1 Tax=uncultured Cocleimonas sp. TaxID=1051587 RepID=UPI00261611A8|nr:MerR family transcriptional regulator [uncultured Cocleimonas sp.]